MGDANLDDPRQKSTASENNYTVVARRYRPKSFGELVGQDNISQALGKAITSGRVGHAYLFTGARGVGKTSTARIFAKALNAPEGSTIHPDNSSDVCQAIDAGEDLDVIEIDGASNRSIEDIRQLRANINVRPSRSRYKIYIIDEVHMLTTPAFNALLKTLEEPPEHVKFIFCTTDADKIPITVLSRCQRFDFAPVNVLSIQRRLKEICELEGFEAEEEALALLARRASGSMRDSQSLLEQVISFSNGKITVDEVYSLLGLADESRLLEIIEALRDHASVKAIKLIEDAMNHGSDPGQLAEQLLSYMRDLMAVAVGGGPELLKLANPAGFENLKVIAEAWGLQTILAAIQILDECLVRMRHSVQARTLLEIALVHTCQLQHLSSVAALLEAARQCSSTGASSSQPKAQAQAEKKNGSSPVVTLAGSSLPRESQALENPASVPTVNTQSPEYVPLAERDAPRALLQASVPSSTREHIPLAKRDDQESRQVSTDPPASTTALEQWLQAVSRIDGMLADFAALAEEVECNGSDEWIVKFPCGGQKSVDYCEAPDNKRTLLACLRAHVGRGINVTFRAKPGVSIRAKESVKSSSAERSQRLRQFEEHPLVKKICTLLDGEIMRVDPAKKSSDSLAGRHAPAVSAAPTNTEVAQFTSKG